MKKKNRTREASPDNRGPDKRGATVVSSLACLTSKGLDLEIHNAPNQLLFGLLTRYAYCRNAVLYLFLALI